MATTAEQARQAAAANPAWYHTIDLGWGVATEGHVDWRPLADRILQLELRGRRTLDVGTFDGFWAFEMEKRGADVLALDLAELEDTDWPPMHRERLAREQREFGVELGRGFKLAHECLGSSVRRVICDVRELTPEKLGGPVEAAFLGSMMLHLRDPIRALENVRTALVPGGDFILLENVSLRETLLHPRSPVARFDTRRNVFNWWLPNVRTLRDYLWAAGFTKIRRITSLLHPPARPEMDAWYVAFRAQAPA